MFGLKKPSLALRIGWGKLIGFSLGGIGFLMLPLFVTDIDMPFRIGVLFWYATMGVIIGFGGIYTSHPIINLRLPWWWRGTIYGVWFNLLLMLFTYDKLAKIMLDFFGSASIFASPWWIVVEGAVVGFVMDGVLTAIAGEGSEIVDS
jgi:hypothetical protein